MRQDSGPTDDPPDAARSHAPDPEDGAVSGLSRREYVKLAGLGAVAASAGCLASSDRERPGRPGQLRYGYGGQAMLVTGLAASTMAVGPTPVARWTLDESSGTTATDAVGSADGTVRGDPVQGQPGIRGAGSYDFRPADGNYVEVPDAAALRPTSELSYGGWLRTTSGDTSQTLLQKANSLTGGAGYALDVQTDNSLRAHVAVDSGEASVNPFGVATHDGEWHHLFVTWDGEALVLYLDGSEVARDESQSGDIVHSERSLFLARGDNSWSSTYELAGSLDDVRVYDAALTAAEVADLFAGTADDGGDETPTETATPTPTETPTDTPTETPTPTPTDESEDDSAFAELGGGALSTLLLILALLLALLLALRSYRRYRQAP